MKIVNVGRNEPDRLSIAVAEDNHFIISEKEIADALMHNHPLEGTYSLAILVDKDRAILARDNLGTRKLFYHNDFSNEILYISHNFIELTERFDSDQIFSVPRGGHLLFHRGKVERIKPAQQGDLTSDFRICNVETVLIEFFKFLRKNLKKKPIVCLSGGLDSTLIANFATKEFGSIDVVTGVLQSQHDAKNLNDINGDFANAKRIADNLNARFHPVFIDKNEVLEQLKDILRASQDWRDYNVHCAALNYFLAKRMRKLFTPKNYVVLTGDFMNEIFADYTAEEFDGKEYYPQPNFNQKTRQRFFMNGLDSSDRELGIFENFGFDCVQPYSFVAHYYKKLTNDKLSQSNAKYEFNGQLLPKGLLKRVGRSKVRAQIGDSTGGMLGHFISSGLTSDRLEGLFCEYFSLDKKFLRQFIEVGVYRTGKY